MIPTQRFGKAIAVTLVLTCGLGGCVVSQPHLGSDFGAAVHQDLLAQITNPNADYGPKTPPPTNGDRAKLAMQRYRTDRPIEPTASASQIGVAGIAGAAQAAPTGP